MSPLTSMSLRLFPRQTFQQHARCLNFLNFARCLRDSKVLSNNWDGRRVKHLNNPPCLQRHKRRLPTPKSNTNMTFVPFRYQRHNQPVMSYPCSRYHQLFLLLAGKTLPVGRHYSVLLSCKTSLRLKCCGSRAVCSLIATFKVH